MHTLRRIARIVHALLGIGVLHMQWFVAHALCNSRVFEQWLPAMHTLRALRALRMQSL